MKLSEVIAAMQEALEKYGDLPVFKDPRCEESYWLDPVDRVTFSLVELRDHGTHKGDDSRIIAGYAYIGAPDRNPNAIEVSM
jgi:hypothetical protein